MLTLAIDTTAKVASAALVEDGKILASFLCNNGNTHTENILPMIDDMLKKCKKSIDDIGLFALANGPGSFTGVRIGASTVKGLAFGRNVPCVEVSTLEALARNLYPINAIICPVMDARRAQVYNALFECDTEGMIRLCPDRAISLDELGRELEARADSAVYLVGDGYEIALDALSKFKINIKETPITLVDENAVSVALVAKERYARGERVSDISLSPSYLRMSQAERELKEKQKNNNI